MVQLVVSSQLMKNLLNMRLTGRKEEHVELVKAYLEQNNMFFTVDKEDPEYTDVIDLDLSTVEASLSGQNVHKI